ncbi:uncharacterized protein B0I36DRAFT_388887 [Microdochium trichocladiopsis]|uniref:Uncharacterized protein n=1 Tax=Microdochium trichocladiopsis TaxID=1682393 RepID=A0A9P8XUJ4_9PEZI|nr:uncharacterized protein B0I36DRAFT_388887 [Microdochium trichocladiopsis]KAH7016184.1 hypothetical protein B0I36DRAFT_388887 [Microdochium trichocladiopsis]
MRSSRPVLCGYTSEHYCRDLAVIEIDWQASSKSQTVCNHQLLLTFDGRKYFSPNTETAKRVLNVGTGTGIWAINFSIQPSEHICTSWTYGVDILQRTSIPTPSTLEPRGWIELQDPGTPSVSNNGTLKDRSPLWQYNRRFIQSAKNLSRPIHLAADHDERLKDAGFINVERKVFKWPINIWPKNPKHREVGLWTLANIEGNLETISIALITRGLGITREEVEVFLVGVRKDLRDRRIPCLLAGLRDHRLEAVTGELDSSNYIKS